MFFSREYLVLHEIECLQLNPEKAKGMTFIKLKLLQIRFNYNCTGNDVKSDINDI